MQTRTAARALTQALKSSLEIKEITMGFSDFFKNLFGKKYVCRFAPEQIDINITGDMIIVNDNKIEIPCHLDRLKELFGQPRKFVGVSGNVNYTWDDIGVYCYTKGNNVVFCIAVKSQVNSEMLFAYDPKSMFKGKLSINGENWEQVMHEGADEDVARSRLVDNLSLFAEYVDFEKGDMGGCEGAYTGVEVQIR